MENNFDTCKVITQVHMNTCVYANHNELCRCRDTPMEMDWVCIFFALWKLQCVATGTLFQNFGFKIFCISVGLLYTNLGIDQSRFIPLGFVYYRDFG